MSRWFRFVGVFVLAFVILDVCTPESCDAVVLASSQAQNELQAKDESASGAATCQFEEDCFNCAHYLASVEFVRRS